MKKPSTAATDRKAMDQLVPEIAFGRLVGLLATTYEMQPEFLETDFLPSVFGLGAWDDRSWTSRISLEKHLAELDCASVLVDAHPYRGRPRSLRVEVTPVALGRRRALHAKVCLCLYERAVRLFVGSANLTEPGYRRNREAISILTASSNRPSESRQIATALQEMRVVLGPWFTASADQLLTETIARLNQWSHDVAESDCAIAWSGGETALWRRFLDRWPAGELVERIKIVSPFWSEEGADGPITTLVNGLAGNGQLRAGAELSLLTDAVPDKENSYKPKLPESFRTFDARTLGVNARAFPVDPRVPPNEVGMGKEFGGSRGLHAKVVLFEGERTSLIYVGSANFTRQGWGFVGPARANVEAGIVLCDAGSTRERLRAMIPAVAGDGIPLTGTATITFAPPDPSPEDQPWPSFLQNVLLAPSESDAERLDLVVNVAEDATQWWRLSLLPAEESDVVALVSASLSEPVRTCYRTPLSRETLNQLLKQHEVLVQWWECEEGRAFPVNVAPTARTALPISPDAGRPEEQNLIAYYQGRVSWEGVFGDEPAPDGPSDGGNQGAEELHVVDTSRIQSYVVREFVEALRGITDDLKSASQSPKACMRLALLGPVSPWALAKRVVDAADSGVRSPTAAGFQLVEILACLDAARMHVAPIGIQSEWATLTDEAAAKIEALLTGLQLRYPTDLTRGFQHYAKAARRNRAQKASSP